MCAIIAKFRMCWESMMEAANSDFNRCMAESFELHPMMFDRDHQNAKKIIIVDGNSGPYFGCRLEANRRRLSQLSFSYLALMRFYNSREESCALFFCGSCWEALCSPRRWLRR